MQLKGTQEIEEMVTDGSLMTVGTILMYTAIMPVIIIINLLE